MALRYKFSHDLDDPERTLEHAEIIRNKVFLKELYRDWYQTLFSEIKDLEHRKVVELGSGGGFLKSLAPTVITSDFLELPTNDMCFSALHMPFPDQSLDGIFMIDTFHHLPDANQFLKEVTRTLKPGGKLIMVEPANSVWGRFIYRNFHHEPFHPQAGWTIPASGPLSGANGALPWIVFERDRDLFFSRYTELVIDKVTYHTPLRYLLSGGVSYPQLFPNFTYSIIKWMDQFLSRTSSQFSMFMTIIVQKNDSRSVVD